MFRTRTQYRMALVTGATSGIGAAFAEILPASTGLLLVGRDQTRLEEMSARLATAGRTIASLPADLSTDEGRESVIARAGQIGIDLLINNAGRGKLGRLLDHELEEARGTVELNVVTPLVLTRALLPDMLAQARKEGRRAGLIIVSSAAAFAPLPYFATYAASKAFDLVLAESLAEELRGEPVDVLALCPGATRTDLGGARVLRSICPVGGGSARGCRGGAARARPAHRAGQRSTASRCLRARHLATRSRGPRSRPHNRHAQPMAVPKRANAHGRR